MTRKSELVDIDLMIKIDSDEYKSILFEDANGAPHWLPRREIETEPKEGARDPRTVTVTMPTWLAEEHKLI